MAKRTPLLSPCIVGLLALGRFGYASATPVNKGEQPVAAQQSTSEDEAVRRLRAAAERGDTTAQTLLSYRLWDGRGVQKNLPQSARWLREGADGGNAMAQVSLGSLYLQGNVEAGLAKDVAQGTEWYRKAVEQGDVTTPSQVSNAADADASLVPEYLGMRASVKRFPGIAAELLGQVYENGGFVPTNYGEAVRWYRRGAELGYENAQWRLGLMYEHGRGVPQDNVQAEKWFIVAVALRGGNGILRGARDELAKKMSVAEVSEAKGQAQEWLDLFRSRKRN